MNSIIVKSYVRLVLAGRRTIEDVPAWLRADVESLLGGAE